MTDYPPGKWSSILVGFYWPANTNLTTLSTQSVNFENTAVGYHQFDDQMQRARSEILASQEGKTVDDLRDAFLRGEENAREIAEKNEIKKSAYDFAYNSAIELRSELTTLAEEGNAKIQQIQDSQSLPSIKIEKIAQIVLECHERAKSRAAIYSENILNATQIILDRESVPASLYQFVKDHGIDITQLLSSPSKDVVHDQARIMLNGENPSKIFGVKGDRLPSASEYSSEPESSPAPIYGAIGKQPHQAADLAPAARGRGLSSLIAGNGLAQVYGTNGEALPPSVGHIPAGTPNGVPTPPHVSAIIPPSAPTASPPTPLSPTAPSSSLPSSGLMQSFDRGVQTGGPMSEATNALSNAPMHAMESHLPPTSVTTETPVRSTIPTSTPPTMLDIPQTAHPPVTSPTINAPANDAATTYMPAPTGTTSPTPAVPPPASPLQTYGADLRPATPTASVSTTPSSPPPAAPASAPVTPSAAAGGMGQPTVVRQPVTPAIAQQTPAGIVEQAVATSAVGAAVGTGSAKTFAHNRLQRLVDAVARQEPRLRWAAGDCPDGTTMLVTDLASGWVPPDIDIPVGVQLRAPSYHRGDIEALLGEVTSTASYTPIHYVVSPKDIEPLTFSLRAREVPPIDDLGWELSQATKWRDGLPQLAHTLAKAASRGTGILDSEIEFLRQERANAREQVLNSYPTSVDLAAVSTWQLLAAINALAENDKAGAQYHFAWFHALNQTKTDRGMS